MFLKKLDVRPFSASEFSGLSALFFRSGGQTRPGQSIRIFQVNFVEGCRLCWLVCQRAVCVATPCRLVSLRRLAQWDAPPTVVNRIKHICCIFQSSRNWLLIYMQCNNHMPCCSVIIICTIIDLLWIALAASKLTFSSERFSLLKHLLIKYW